jgi:hypothetical protein
MYPEEILLIIKKINKPPPGIKGPGLVLWFRTMYSFYPIRIERFSKIFGQKWPSSLRGGRMNNAFQFLIEYLTNRLFHSY